MTCRDFLARQSEYMDEVMHPLEAALWRKHAECCPSCARYDRVMRRGLRLARDLASIEPSPDFHPRLQYRLNHMEESLRAGSRASGAGAVLSLAVAGALALLAWGPLLGPGPVVGRAPTDGQSIAGGEGAAAEKRDEGLKPQAEPVARPGQPVQLAAEAGAGAHAVGVAGAVRGEPGPVRPAPPAVISIPSGVAAWWIEPRPASLSGTHSVFHHARMVERHIPGPFSPLVVGAPAFRPASVGATHR